MVLCAHHCLSQLEHDLICLTTTTQLVVLLCYIWVYQGPEHESLSLAVHLHSFDTLRQPVAGSLKPCQTSGKWLYFFLSSFPVDIFTTSNHHTSWSSCFSAFFFVWNSNQVCKISVCEFILKNCLTYIEGALFIDISKDSNIKNGRKM